MATLSESLVSSSARKLPIRMRPDLSARKQQYLGRTYQVVKDPVGLNYYRFQEEEYAILRMLDGQTSLDEIKERFEDEFPPQKITLEELQQFLGMLHRSGLVITGAPGQGHQLRKRRDERRRKEILGACTNILCIRFKGLDPERFLNWLYPKVHLLFTRLVLVTCFLMALAALTLVIVEFDVFQSRLPGFYQFFNFYNALWLAATLGVIKIVHEFGHGLSCKHFGGECHEMGVMILVLTPCLYCNVSDSWMLPNKWHRALIGAAGIIVELTMASIATFLWWFTTPETFWANLFLNVMFVASISTILFNGNPLLRYDGYYILSDIIEIPNLRQKATTILSRKLGQLCLGLEPPDDPFLPKRNQVLFALYSVAAATYRWFILASICWFLLQVFDPYGLRIIGQGIVAMSLYGLLVVPLYKLVKFFYVPGRIDKVKKPRMYTTIGVLVALVATIVYLPLPYSVMCPVEIQARDAESVYVDVTGGGKLQEILVEPGQQVTKGTKLARLTNVDLDLEIARLTGQRDQRKAELNAAHRMRLQGDRLAGSEIPQIEEALKTVQEQLEGREEDRKRLTLKAPIDGTVLPPPTTAGREGPEGQLRFWSGTPLQDENTGAHLTESVLFCQIGDPRRLEAILIVDQVDRNLVMVDQEVEIKLDELPHDVLPGKITEMSKQTMDVASQQQTAKTGGELATETDPATGAERPQSASYQARVPLVDNDGELLLGLRGRAKVHTRWLPLGTRIWRFVNHTFSFKM